ncbi:hypothetical protein ASF61_16800 [Duganella sp. Leaf126]|uniref:phage head closure protein n=1 Tax=Duganella sp. Leaf126 TaxID=1736266 RepID=UPI0006F24747|nr:phage head closure protein [Duganella sp. Leaf126]KQQ31993.1 hypothetical protein ASF61_16800 [Duganella sp. Leaf126]
MGAGQRRYLITVQAAPAGSDENGDLIREWREVCKEYADIRLPSGLEAIRADAVVSSVRASIRIPYRSDLTADMRVVHGTAFYNVKAVLPDMAHRKHTDLICELIK